MPLWQPHQHLSTRQTVPATCILLHVSERLTPSKSKCRGTVQFLGAMGSLHKISCQKPISCFPLQHGTDLITWSHPNPHQRCDGPDSRVVPPGQPLHLHPSPNQPEDLGHRVMSREDSKHPGPVLATRSFPGAEMRITPQSAGSWQAPARGSLAASWYPPCGCAVPLMCLMPAACLHMAIPMATCCCSTDTE